MRHRSFRSLFHYLVAASLPLAISGCDSTVAGPFPNGCGSQTTTSVVPPPDGGEVPQMPTMMQCQALCGSVVVSCAPAATDGGASAVACTYPLLCTGRRPAGLEESSDNPPCCELGAYFAQLAQLEEASVRAFSILRKELAAHGAPRALVRAASQSRWEEVRHTRLARALARHHGIPVVTARPVARHDVRPLMDIACENATEGCVRETYGALLATWQAMAAQDPRVRTAMQVIAPDETRHAELAWAVADWLDECLGASARRQVHQARAAALAALQAELAVEPSAALQHSLGLPSAAQTRQLLAGLQTTLQCSA